MDSEIDRKVAALVPDRPPRPRPGRRASCTSSPRCRAIDGDARRRARSATASRTSSSAVAAAWTGPPARSCGCCPSGSTSTTVRAQARRRRRRRPAAAARHQREGAGTGRPRRRRRAAPAGLRRRAVRQERACCAATSRRSCAPARPRRRRSSSSTTGARCSARCPTTYLLDYLTSRRPGAAGARRPGRRTSRAGSPGPTSPPSSCATGRGGPGAEVFVVVDDYDLVATQQGSPVQALAAAAGAGPRHRPAPRRRPALRRRRRGRSTSR